jgi:hypothetical protein
MNEISFHFVRPLFSKQYFFFLHSWERRVGKIPQAHSLEQQYPRALEKVEDPSSSCYIWIQLHALKQILRMFLYVHRELRKYSLSGKANTQSHKLIHEKCSKLRLGWFLTNIHIYLPCNEISYSMKLIENGNGFDRPLISTVIAPLGQ